MPAPEPLAAPPTDLAADHELIVETVREAGTLAMRYFRTDVQSWRKARDEPVSEADLKVDRFLRERLRAARPDYGWLSEETRADPERLEKDRVFIVDPIDGTRAFLRGQPHFTVCAAVVERGRPTAAAVYNPATGEMFEALLGGGARRNGETLRVGARSELAGARLLADRETFAPRHWDRPWPPMTVENRNSTAYRLALVACGAFDATVSLWAKKDWDLAAAELILSEAGGLATTHAGQPFTYNGPKPRQPSLLAANPALHAALHVRLAGIERLPSDS